VFIYEHWAMGGSKIEALPSEAQLSPVYALLIEDKLTMMGLRISIGWKFHQRKNQSWQVYAATEQFFKRSWERGKFKVIPNKGKRCSWEGEIRDFPID